MAPFQQWDRHFSLFRRTLKCSLQGCPWNLPGLTGTLWCTIKASALHREYTTVSVCTVSTAVSNCSHIRNLHIVVYMSFKLHVSLMPSIKRDISSFLCVHVDQAKLTMEHCDWCFFKCFVVSNTPVNTQLNHLNNSVYPYSWVSASDLSVCGTVGDPATSRSCSAKRLTLAELFFTVSSCPQLQIARVQLMNPNKNIHTR